MSNKGWMRCEKDSDNGVFFTPGTLYPVTALPGEPDTACGGKVSDDGCNVVNNKGLVSYLLTDATGCGDAYGTFTYIPPTEGDDDAS